MVQFNCPHCKNLVGVVIGLATVIVVTCEICGHRYEIKIDSHVHPENYSQNYFQSYNSDIVSGLASTSAYPSHPHLPENFWK